jgi:hypothetical protein
MYTETSAVETTVATPEPTPAPTTTPVAHDMSQFQGIIDAVAKALVPSIVKAIMEDDSFESHIRTLANDEAETEIDRFMCNSFDLWDHEDTVREIARGEVDEDRIREVIQDMTFEVSVS